MKVKDLFVNGLTMDHTISEMVDLMASVDRQQGRELVQYAESVDYTTSKRSQNPLIDATLSYLGTATSLSEANEPKEKKGTAWTRKVVGKGSTAHNSRGSFGGGHSLTHTETQSRVQKAVEAGKKSGDVVSHNKTTDDDGTVHHSIMLSKDHGYYRHVHISSHPDRVGGEANTNFATMNM